MTRITAANLSYRGCCRTPQGYHNPPPPSGNIADTLASGGRGLTYSPSGSVFMFGHPYGQKVVELRIPSLGIPASDTDFDAMPVASVLQYAMDPTGGQWAVDGADSAGGLLVVGDTLLSSYYKSYDSNQSQSQSHCIRPTLALGGAPSLGPFQLGSDTPPLTSGVTHNCGFYHGYMGIVPPEWQNAFGGDIFVGQGSTVSILARTSNGPGIFVTRASYVGVLGSPNPRPLVYYPAEHSTLDGYNEPPGPHVDNCPVEERKTNKYWLRADRQNAVVMIPGTSTVMVFGNHGIGGYAYGQGSLDKAQDGVAYSETGEVFVYDVANQGKGPHSASDDKGTTYRATIWCYDANELVAVTKGLREPWSVLPYEMITLTLPFASYNPNQDIVGACWDEKRQLLYVNQSATDFAGGSAAVPVIHAFAFASGGTITGGAPPPA